MHVQAQHKNEKRRRQDSDSESDRKRPAPCTPPKRGRTLVHDSDFELDDADADPDEYDDDASVASSKTPRKKIQPQWQLIGTKHKSQYSTDAIDRWLAASADAEMIKAGPIEGKHSSSGRMASMAPSLGGFKLAHVSYRIRISHLFPMNA